MAFSNRGPLSILAHDVCVAWFIRACWISLLDFREPWKLTRPYQWELTGLTSSAGGGGWVWWRWAPRTVTKPPTSHRGPLGRPRMYR